MATIQHSSHRLVILRKAHPTSSRPRGRRTMVPISHRQVGVLWDVGRGTGLLAAQFRCLLARSGALQHRDLADRFFFCENEWKVRLLAASIQA